MTCTEAQARLGLHVDGELPPDQAEALQQHLAACPACQEEHAAIRQLATALSNAQRASVPPRLWPAIDQSLDRPRDALRRIRGTPAKWRRPWVLGAAAGVVLLVGLGLLDIAQPDSRAEASPVDFSMLLDGLSNDARGAFDAFLARYEAKPGSAALAHGYAPQLSFAVPEMLPGGFRRETVHFLRFGDHPGVAAEYARNGEFLATVFHQPVRREDFGTHRDYPCVIGEHRGHKVEVGPWKLVHLTDPTTCHCVLTRLDEHTELPAVLAAVAPSPPVTALDGQDAAAPDGHGELP